MVQCNDCVSIGTFNSKGCQILKILNETGNGFPCSSSDTAAGRYVQAYWTSQDYHLPGIKREYVSDGVHPAAWGVAGLSAVLDHYSCDFDGCNKPGMAAQATCMATKTTFSSSDYCSGIPFTINCASRSEWSTRPSCSPLTIRCSQSLRSITAWAAEESLTLQGIIKSYADYWITGNCTTGLEELCTMRLGGTVSYFFKPLPRSDS